MKRYQYETVHIGEWRGRIKEDHRQIISEYAQKGWRYTGWIPTRIIGYGAIRDIDLIFEADTDDPWAAQ